MILKIDQQDIYYEIHGEGPPLLMLHGWGSHLNNFSALIDTCKTQYTVYALDFPGFGQSPEPETTLSIYDYAELTEKFMDALKIPAPILLAHSFGGRVALIIGSRRKLPKMIITGGAGIRPDRAPSYYVKTYGYKLMRLLAKVPLLNLVFKEMVEDYRKKVGSSDYNAASPRMRQVLSKVVAQDLRHHLKDITAPCLLIWGDLDTATPLKDGELMAREIPNAGLAVIKKGTHYAFLEQHQLFVSIMNKFLEE
ncbi:MAG: alpha/beta hydrolase [Clostridia bacterium]|nr:alpha/beta hydrolase [Clostridia bacterium]